MFAFIESGKVTEYPISHTDIRKKFPNTSFPKDLTTVDLTDFGVVEVVSTDSPSAFTEEQKIQEVEPVYKNGVWTQAFEIVPLTEEEIQANTAYQEANIRAQRDNQLFLSDWTQLQDSPLSNEEVELWAIYRQELRDITTQSSYPEKVVWPTIPN